MLLLLRQEYESALGPLQFSAGLTSILVYTLFWKFRMVQKQNYKKSKCSLFIDSNIHPTGKENSRRTALAA